MSKRTKRTETTYEIRQVSKGGKFKVPITENYRGDMWPTFGTYPTESDADAAILERGSGSNEDDDDGGEFEAYVVVAVKRIVWQDVQHAAAGDANGGECEENPTVDLSAENLRLRSVMQAAVDEHEKWHGVSMPDDCSSAMWKIISNGFRSG